MKLPSSTGPLSHGLPRLLFTLAVFLLLGLLTLPVAVDDVAAAPPAADQAIPSHTGSIYYPETGHSVTGGFLDYWLDNGQASVLGYPLTDEVKDGALTVQYFERVRLEYNPKIGGKSIRLSNSGTLLTADRAFPKAKPFKNSKDRIYVAATQHSLGGSFYAYYKKNGGAGVFGNPISEEFRENGRTVQYFERARFELVSGKVRLGKVGAELMAQQVDAKYRAAQKRPQYAMTFNGLASNFPANWSRVISLNQSWGNLPYGYKGYGLYAAMPADLNLYGRWGKVSKGGKSIWVQFIDVVAYKDIAFFREHGRVIDLGTESFQQFAPLKAGIIRVDVAVAWPGEGPDN